MYSCVEWFGGRLPGVLDAASDLGAEMMPATLHEGIMLPGNNASIVDVAGECVAQEEPQTPCDK